MYCMCNNISLTIYVIAGDPPDKVPNAKIHRHGKGRKSGLCNETQTVELIVK